MEKITIFSIDNSISKFRSVACNYRNADRPSLYIFNIAFCVIEISLC